MGLRRFFLVPTAHRLVWPPCVYQIAWVSLSETSSPPKSNIDSPTRPPSTTSVSTTSRYGLAEGFFSSITIPYSLAYNMENLTLEETPLPGGPMGGSPMPLGPGIPPPQNQQLPPQMFTTAAQLLDLTDSKSLDFHSLRWVGELYGRRRKTF